MKLSHDPLVFSPLLHDLRAVVLVEPELVAVVLQLALFTCLFHDQVFSLVSVKADNNGSRPLMRARFGCQSAVSSVQLRERRENLITKHLDEELGEKGGGARTLK